METTTLLIQQRSLSSWVSCQSIVSNLRSVYESILTDFEILHFDRGGDEYNEWGLARKIAQLKPSRVIFIDHKPHPGQLIQKIFRTDPEFKSHFIFHVFGDFTLYPQQWTNLEQSLKNQKTTFFCASTKQLELIRTLIQDENIVKKFPFPLREDVFHFDKLKRAKFRDQFQIKRNECAFLYTGRLSEQKKVRELMKQFSFILKMKPSAKLFIAGGFDDLGIPYIGKEALPGSYLAKWMITYDKIQNEWGKEKVYFLGNLSASKLADAYNGCDVFVSLSVHNDEDFGMSPAEAGMCGCRLILSDWGGYSSFKEYSPSHCHLFNVEVNKDAIQLNKAQILKLLLKHGEVAEEDERTLIAKNFKEALSVTSLGSILGRLLTEDPGLFTGFKKSMHLLGDRYKLNPQAPFSNKEGSYSSFYSELYRPYFRSFDNEQ